MVFDVVFDVTRFDEDLRGASYTKFTNLESSKCYLSELITYHLRRFCQRRLLNLADVIRLVGALPRTAPDRILQTARRHLLAAFAGEVDVQETPDEQSQDRDAGQHRHDDDPRRNSAVVCQLVR